MNHQDSVAFWSFPLGTWFGVQVRVSWFFPVLIAYFLIRPDYTPALGAAVSGVCGSQRAAARVRPHSGARLTGGSGNEILLWPLGGLAFVRPASNLKSQLLATGGGPLVNLALCLATLHSRHAASEGSLSQRSPQPLRAAASAFAKRADSGFLVFTFCINWLLFLVNLDPRNALGRRTHAADPSRPRESAIGERWKFRCWSAFIVGVIAMVVGLFVEGRGIVLIGAVVFIVNLMERHQLQQTDQYDESFMGYDFSQGYTSLEQSETETERPPGFWKRWRLRRRAEKERRQAEKDQEAERVLDFLLDKVHQHGMQSLSEAEKRQLARVSARYRDKGNPQT